MDDLTAFLRDRYDEAFAAADSSPDVGRYDEVELQAKFDMPGYHAEYYASVPASLRRAEITAKRQILDEHRYPEGLPQMSCPRCASWDEDDRTYSFSTNPCLTLRLLALPYAGHPDYDESWKP